MVLLFWREKNIHLRLNQGNGSDHKSKSCILITCCSSRLIWCWWNSGGTGDPRWHPCLRVAGRASSHARTPPLQARAVCGAARSRTVCISPHVDDEWCTGDSKGGGLPAWVPGVWGNSLYGLELIIAGANLGTVREVRRRRVDGVQGGGAAFWGVWNKRRTSWNRLIDTFISATVTCQLSISVLSRGEVVHPTQACSAQEDVAVSIQQQPSACFIDRWKLLRSLTITLFHFDSRIAAHLCVFHQIQFINGFVVMRHNAQGSAQFTGLILAYFAQKNTAVQWHVFWGSDCAFGIWPRRHLT